MLMFFSYFDENYRFHLVNLEVVTFLNIYAWTSQYKEPQYGHLTTTFIV